MLNFSRSLGPVLKQRQEQAREEREKILNPDTSGRLRFPSQGDPPRERPQRSWFQTDEHFKSALAHWELEQKREADVYRRSLGQNRSFKRIAGDK